MLRESRCYVRGYDRENGTARLAFPAAISKAVRGFFKFRFGLTLVGDTLCLAGGDSAVATWDLAKCTFAGVGKKRKRQEGEEEDDEEEDEEGDSSDQGDECDGWGNAIAPTGTAEALPGGSISEIQAISRTEVLRCTGVLSGHDESPNISRQLCAENGMLFSSEPSGMCKVWDSRTLIPVITLKDVHSGMYSEKSEKLEPHLLRYVFAGGADSQPANDG
eukprot:gene4500-43408_t